MMMMMMMMNSHVRNLVYASLIFIIVKFVVRPSLKDQMHYGVSWRKSPVG